MPRHGRRGHVELSVEHLVSVPVVRDGGVVLVSEWTGRQALRRRIHCMESSTAPLKVSMPETLSHEASGMPTGTAWRRRIGSPESAAESGHLDRFCLPNPQRARYL